MSEKIRAGIIGATGMVGQRFITLLENHPFFEVSAIAASPSSAGKAYEEATGQKWKMDTAMPDYIKNKTIINAADVNKIADASDFVFCAVDMGKDEIIAMEEAFARSETPVVSNNSACRKFNDVPMVIPEINDSHLEVIKHQKNRLGTKRGFIAVKPNCSIQSYVPLLTPLLKFGITEVAVSMYQAISGAGKSFRDWPEMIDNIIPYIGGEEEKSEAEPLKIWGEISGGEIIPAKTPVITAQCIRVPVTDGHMASVFVKFEKKPDREEILSIWDSYKGKPQKLNLPSAPNKFIHYFNDNDRPQTKLDRDAENGMAVCAGRLRADTIFDYKFIGLSHNTLRGAAGGAVLIAELLKAEGYIECK